MQNKLNALNGTIKQNGVVAIEFALVMTFILVPLLLGTVEFGRLFYQYNSLAKSVRDSAKYISTHVYSTDTTYSPNYTTYVGEAKCLAVYASGCNNDKKLIYLPPLVPVVPNLTTANIIIEPPVTVSGVKVITVMVSNYKPSLITNFLSTLGFVDFKFNNISVSMRQQE